MKAIIMAPLVSVAIMAGLVVLPIGVIAAGFIIAQGISLFLFLLI